MTDRIMNSNKFSWSVADFTGTGMNIHGLFCVRRTHKCDTTRWAVGWRKCGHQMKNGRLTVSHSSFSHIGAMKLLRDGNQWEMCFEDESGK